jgi:hypothetical protein
MSRNIRCEWRLKRWPRKVWACPRETYPLADNQGRGKDDQGEAGAIPARVQAGGGSAGGVGPEHGSGIANAGGSGANVVQLGQGTSRGQVAGADSRSKVTGEQMEISRLRAEVARVTMERDILGKAMA